MLITGKTNVGMWRDNNEDNFATCTYRMDGIQCSMQFVLGMVLTAWAGTRPGMSPVKSRWISSRVRSCAGSSALRIRPIP